jgi:hypothetical protein
MPAENQPTHAMKKKLKAANKRPKAGQRRALGLATGSELARVLLMHAVGGIFDGCGNSYANSYTEKWLTHAKALGVYRGRVTGNIIELRQEWEEWLDANGLPDLPNSDG